jgi:transcriptional regulator with XRE-family HTH domain
MAAPTRKTSRGSIGWDLKGDTAHDYRRRVGAWLREKRLQRGLRQIDVAERIGIKSGDVSGYENGRGTPPPECYRALASLLRVRKVTFGKTMLRYTNPWAYRMLFGDDDGSIQADIERLAKGR